jgi:hypothetical protein
MKSTLFFTLLCCSWLVTAYADPIWESTPDGPCPTGCGGGAQFLTSVCHSPPGTVVADSVCTGAGLVKPEAQTCNVQACLGTWEVVSYTACTKTCGTGIHTPTSRCAAIADPATTLADTECYTPGKPGTSTCNTQMCGGVCGYVDQANCLSNGCWWEAYTPHVTVNPIAARCYVSRAQVNTLYPCAAWSGLTSPDAFACAKHGCSLIESFCADVGSGDTDTDNSTVISFSLETAFINPHMIANTLRFGFSTVTSMNFEPNNPVWGINGIGPQYFGLPPVITPGICNGYPVGSTNTVPSHVTYTGTREDFVAYCSQWINTHNDMSFDSSTNGVGCRAWLGDVHVSPTTLVNNITVPVLGSIRYDQSIDLTTAVDNCIGATATQYADHTLYMIPTSYIVRTIHNGIVQSAAIFYIDVSTHGAISISANSRWKNVATLRELQASSTGCAANEQRLTSTIELTYRNVFDATILVGPRSLDDILLQDPGNVALSNCNTKVSLQTLPLNTVTHEQKHLVKLQSRCRAIDEDGLAFATCARAHDADRIADMGSDIPYPTSLDKQHNMWVNVHACPAGQPESVSCTLENSAPTGEADVVYVSYSLSVLPSHTSTYSFHVSAGFLPTPTSALTALQVLASSNPQTTLPLTRSVALTWDKALTFLMRLDDVALHSYDLRLVTTEVTLVPMSTNGAVLTSSPVLTFSDIRSALTYVDKSTAAVATGALTLPACAGTSGCDGFSVPVLDVKDKSAAQGYQLTIGYQTLLPVTNVAHGRRLLSTLGIPHHERQLLSTVDIPVNITIFNGTLTTFITIEPYNVLNAIQGGAGHQSYHVKYFLTSFALLFGMWSTMGVLTVSFSVYRLLGVHKE